MAKINFYRGLRANYKPDVHGNGIYFATDTFEILMGGNRYGGLDPEKTVKDIQQGSSADKLIVTYTDDFTSELTVGKSTYTSGIEDTNLAMPEKVGGLAKGTKVADLNGKSYDAMFDDLLFPTVNPTFTPPSATLSLKSGGTTREVGVAAPGQTDFTTGLNKGAITLNGVKQGDRSGAIKDADSYIYVNGNKETKELPAKVALGNTTYNFHAEYKAGPQPKDNKGNNYSSPLPAGGVDSSAVTINGTYPWYATTVDNQTETKQALIAWSNGAGSMTTPKFTVKPSGGGNQIFKLPRKINSLQMENTISGKMEPASLGEWTETTEVVQIGGQDVTYYKYTYNGAARDAVNLIAKF